MGYAKEKILDEHAQYQTAMQIAIDAGVLERCEYHGEVYDPLNGAGNEAAHRLGVARLSAGKLEHLISSPDELKSAIDMVVADSGMQCGQCSK